MVRSWARKKNPSFELNPTWDIPRLVAFLEAYREKSGLQPTQPPASDGFEAVPVDFRHFPVFSQSKWIEGHVVVHEPPTTEGAFVKERPLVWLGRLSRWQSQVRLRRCSHHVAQEKTHHQAFPTCAPCCLSFKTWMRRIREFPRADSIRGFCHTGPLFAGDSEKMKRPTVMRSRMFGAMCGRRRWKG